ncbi:site-specific integrase [Paenibacillus sp. LHD-117]|uniref:tyrosine-type recombinase/integrase n=1 Tax=Paenibacillus sp. LHD-117 TaxID=3071412 RepID=UPI0027E1F42A|nr:site-specific integrase [Paenibacillus sp. LHD-117]MDQ6419922.1 site-specific integrase [Paenibacillus sp. LHD-117]
MLKPLELVERHVQHHVLLDDAVKRGQIGSNPAAGAILPKEEETDEDIDEVPKFLEKDQLLAVIRAAKDKAAEAERPRDAFGWRQFSRTVFILAHTGMRIGELGALEPVRIDTKKLTVKIAATLYEKRGLRHYEIGPPKTKESRRTIDISRRVADVFDAQLRDLKAFRLLSGSKYHTEREFAFVMPTSHLPGYPLRQSKINDMLEEALEAAGIPRKLITAHGLRHTFTSLSAEAEVTLEDIQKQLGHASDEMTKRVYYHVTETRRRANVDKLDALLGEF